ncbi:MAG TPA: nuclear transport factor 2 family protein [Prosthecobacter sp.]|nr:nuclear transport factor 2 family protein [Prosthecobacter sp.]
MRVFRPALLLACGIMLLAACSPSEPRHPEEPALRSFLERYFSTWSAKNIEGYGACFHSSARITFVDKGGESASQGLTDFLHSQKLSHAQSAYPMSEVPTDITISGDSRIAQAAVRWKLTKGAETVTGTDYFTLVKSPAGWRIIALAFYND